VGIFITKEYIMKKIVRLTESDINRIVKRVISEQEPATTQPTEKTCDYHKPYYDYVKKFEDATGLSFSTGDNATALVRLLGRKVCAKGGYYFSGEDLSTRIKNYDNWRTSKGLTQLPSGDLISLILTLK
jgi:hypothetical protein